MAAKPFTVESSTFAANSKDKSHFSAMPESGASGSPAAQDVMPLRPKFQGDLLILPHIEARILPTIASTAPPTPFILNLFTDASFSMNRQCKGPSKPSQPAGAAVLWKPWPGLMGVDPWHSRAFQILACRDFQEAELFAVVAGLETAVLLSHLMPELREVIIFTDCQDSIRKLIAAAENASDPLVERAVNASVKLDAKGIRALVRWCPGHVGIEGNEKADGLAKDVRYYNFRHLVPRDQPASVTGYEISDEYLERAHRGDWWKDGLDVESRPRTEEENAADEGDSERTNAPEDDTILPHSHLDPAR